MNSQKYSDKDVQYYLWNYDANKEERRCLRLWINDGHRYTENDYGEENMDFLTSVRTLYCYSILDYTSSFYDPRTQKYIRSLNPTRSELRFLRKSAKEGIPFNSSLLGNANTELLTSYRNRESDLADLFRGCFDELLDTYVADYLVHKHLCNDFLSYARDKETNTPCVKTSRSEYGDGDLPF